ncbi:PREDICTED: uncharacterized protein LOC109230374 [Nicotiana attenuata]|uniref:uncharacterized protein LOC109230374 n=1 Tax=Nicotiana attenuata TaxID=49451 RepID=UPI000904E6D1|nr:PREDICTED: uncharacterized protein LOC109230374 [Nicotiana attenuata]
MSEERIAANNSDNFIPLSTENKARLYSPWKYSIIVKVFGRKVSYLTLKQNLQQLWKPTEALALIDLGNDFLIKYQKEESMTKSLHEGPWFVLGHFLSVRRYEPKFLVSSSKLTYTTIWSRLPELPTEFYDTQILQQVGNKLGKLLKIDTCTSSTLRGKYGRICIEVPLEQPLKSHVFIRNHRQQILYKGLNMLCVRLGRIGHPTTYCPSKITQTVHQHQQPPLLLLTNEKQLIYNIYIPNGRRLLFQKSNPILLFANMQ